MNYTIRIVEREEQKALIIRDCVGMLKLPKVMGPAYMKIADYLKTNGIEPQEAPFTSYRVDDWDAVVQISGFKMVLSIFTKKWDIEMGFPTKMELNGTDEIEVMTIPAGAFVETLHIGPYQKVGEAYKAIYHHAKENDLVLDNKSYEFYLNDPGNVAKEKLETRIWVRAEKG